VTGTVKNGKVIAVTSRKHKTKKKVVVGRARATIAAGHTTTTKISLKPVGKRLLTKRHTLRVKLVLTQSVKTVATKRLTFKAKKKTKKRHH
jgi:hypothetical protein